MLQLRNFQYPKVYNTAQGYYKGSYRQSLKLFSYLPRAPLRRLIAVDGMFSLYDQYKASSL